MMSLTFGLFAQVSASGPLGPLVYFNGLHTIIENTVIWKVFIFIFFFISYFTSLFTILHVSPNSFLSYKLFSFYKFIFEKYFQIFIFFSLIMTFHSIFLSSELQIRRSNWDNSAIIFLISQLKHML